MASTHLPRSIFDPNLADGDSLCSQSNFALHNHSAEPLNVTMAQTLVPNSADAVFIVTGGNRGLGFEHVKQFLEKTKVKIVATARQPAKADQLNGFLKQYKDRLSVTELDTGDEASIEVY